LRLDLQLHTRVGSGDSSINPEELPEACRRAGLDGIGVTEHRPSDYDLIRSPLEREGLTFVPGREVAVGPHHVLVLSSDETLLAGLPVRARAEDLDDPRLACLWAHPAFPGGASVYPPMVPPYEKLKSVVHAVELLNGRRLHIGSGLLLAADAARSLGLPTTAGSDAHSIDEVGKCFTDVQCSPDAGAAGVVKAIRGGRVSAHLSAAWAELHGYDYRQDLAEFVR
jgi:predicted metal-dependent phosphoesterase TrpH